MRLTANKIAGILRQRGYKLTAQRRAILQVIASQEDHLSPETLYERTKEQCPGVGLVTVYRTLQLLDSLSLVCRVHSSAGCRDYMMRRPTEHHHHLVCSDCGRAIDFGECDLGELESRLSRQTGFEIQGHLLELYGKCGACRTAMPDGA